VLSSHQQKSLNGNELPLPVLSPLVLIRSSVQYGNEEELKLMIPEELLEQIRSKLRVGDALRFSRKKVKTITDVIDVM